MTAYYNDLKLFFQRAGAAGGRRCCTSSPTCGRYLQQRATNDNATTVPAKVGSSRAGRRGRPAGQRRRVRAGHRAAP